jgi:uncharacterized protein
MSSNAARTSIKVVLYISLPMLALQWGPSLARRALRLPIKEERLLLAITSHDLTGVRAALREGASANAPLIFGQPSLSVAASSAPGPILEELLKAGADVSFTDDNGVTALCRAAMRGRCGTVELLLSAGADPNSSPRFSPLNMAAHQGHVDVVAILLNAGADIEGRGPQDRTPLLNAAMSGSIETVRLLLEAGADITAVDDTGQTADVIAALQNNPELAALLKDEWQHTTTIAKRARRSRGS